MATARLRPSPESRQYRASVQALSTLTANGEPATCVYPPAPSSPSTTTLYEPTLFSLSATRRSGEPSTTSTAPSTGSGPVARARTLYPSGREAGT